MTENGGKRNEGEKEEEGLESWAISFAAQVHVLYQNMHPLPNDDISYGIS